MRRVGYDADTQVYTYQDEDGTYWEGPEGARYGSLRRGTQTDLQIFTISTIMAKLMRERNSRLHKPRRPHNDRVHRYPLRNYKFCLSC
jgi:hypothetical protein